MTGLFQTIARWVLGTTTNDNAPAGFVGEFMSSNVALASAVALTTETAANVTSIVLTPGDWTVSGNVSYLLSGSVPSVIINQVTSTSAQVPNGEPNAGGYIQIGHQVDGNTTLPAGIRRFQVASGTTTTVYLVAYCTFAAGSVSAYGFISARRVR